MKKVLFVGEHPWSRTGNANMMAALLEQVDRSQYEAACFLVNDVHPRDVSDIFTPFPFPFINSRLDGDPWGQKALVELLQLHDFDIVVMVGIDIWRYLEIFQMIEKIREMKKFNWIALFPYDLTHVRKDWLTWINFVQFPFVYSVYGLNILQEHLHKVQYFRPPLHNAHMFKPVTDEQKKALKKKFFKDLPDDSVLYGFIGANQIRKGIPRMIQGFAQAAMRDPNIYLYLHTDPKGTYNIKQLIVDSGVPEGRIRYKGEGIKLDFQWLLEVYQSFDVYINCSFQEGLSWTVLEAMLCGLPVIASDTTAHTELLEGEAGIAVPAGDFEQVPLMTASGPSYVNTVACSPADIRDAVLNMADPDIRKEYSSRGISKALDWVANTNHVSELLEVQENPSVVEDAILFAQHSSAGDVLMTTRALRGLKERHKGLRLVYMTQPCYFGLLESNPYIDELIPWDGKKLKGFYKHTYKPHYDKILQGGWNQLDVRLTDMYHTLCGVEPGPMFLREQHPVGLGLKPHKYIVVQTSGGDNYYRTYAKMAQVFHELEGTGIEQFDIVQIGSLKDEQLNFMSIDLRGQLSWNESAWVMRNAKAALVIDSFPAHLAGYTGTPAVVLFGPAPIRVTQPHKQFANVPMTYIEPNRLTACPLTTTCWGNAGKEICTSPCINTIDPKEVADALLELLQWKGERN